LPPSARGGDAGFKLLTLARDHDDTLDAYALAELIRIWRIGT
jgi:hypothetical protein